MKPWIALILAGALTATLAGCASMVNSLTGNLAEDLATTILNSDDPATIRDGVPAYLILIDSLLRGDPDSEQMLIAAARLNGAFVSLLEEQGRAAQLSSKALDYAERATCAHRRSLCAIRAIDLDRFRERVAGLGTDDVEVAYTLAVAWLGWIAANSGNWSAIAELSRPRALLERLVEIDEGYDEGNVHLYLGALDTLLPASMGGRPESGRVHLERAIELSGGRFLMGKVIYARQYARLQFDQELHDRLLREVLAAETRAPGMTLANVLAQEEARTLLAESPDYF